MPLDQLPELAKPREVAAYLRISVNGVYDAVNRAENPMPAVRLGPHQLRVPRHALAIWLGLTATDIDANTAA
jgi:excisionase family DNA binding protein